MVTFGAARIIGCEQYYLRSSLYADMVALDAGHHAMVGLSAPEMLSAHVFASNRTSALHSVWVGGRARVVAGRHALRESAAQAFLGARRALIAES